MYELELIDYIFITATITYCIWLVYDSYFNN